MILRMTIRPYTFTQLIWKITSTYVCMRLDSPWEARDELCYLDDLLTNAIENKTSIYARCHNKGRLRFRRRPDENPVFDY